MYVFVDTHTQTGEMRTGRHQCELKIEGKGREREMKKEMAAEWGALSSQKLGPQRVSCVAFRGMVAVHILL